MKTPYPIKSHELFGYEMRVPRELDDEYAASRGLSAWEPIPEGKTLTVIGDNLELLPAYTAPITGEGKPAMDDGMIGIVGAVEIAKFCEWYWGRLQ